MIWQISVPLVVFFALPDIVFVHIKILFPLVHLNLLAEGVNVNYTISNCFLQDFRI